MALADLRITMQFRMVALTLHVTIALAMLAGAAHAQGMYERAGYHAAAVTPAATLTDGEVRKVDKQTQKITIKHGPIRNLDMPAMTMVFRVADAAILDQVKVGDKIRFVAERPGGTYTVTRIEPIK